MMQKPFMLDARQVKNVSGRKTDVLDCQWIQQLHTYGLLNGAFRPTEEVCALRSYVRQRTMLIQSVTTHIQHLRFTAIAGDITLNQAVVTADQQLLFDTSGNYLVSESAVIGNETQCQTHSIRL